jgi:hypothetical protein
MTMRKLMIGTVIAAALGAAALPAAARTNVDFYVNVAPPPAYYEAVPAPRAGFVWVPGYWDWRYNRYHWTAGHWVRHRPGHYYAPVLWHHRDGRYYYNRAGWQDADRDGVPNRYDRAPADPRWR